MNGGATLPPRPAPPRGTVGVAVSPLSGCPEGLSWGHGAHLYFNATPEGLWHELVYGGAGRSRGSWGRPLISVEVGVVGGKAKAVVADGLCGGQREGRWSWQPQREASEKGLVAGQEESWTGVASGTALRKRRRAPGPALFQVAEVEHILEMATMTGVWSGASAPVSSVVGRTANLVQCAGAGWGRANPGKFWLAVPLPWPAVCGDRAAQSWARGGGAL